MDQAFLEACDIDDSYGRSSPICAMRIGERGREKLAEVASMLEMPRSTLARRLVIKGLAEFEFVHNTLYQR